MMKIDLSCPVLVLHTTISEDGVGTLKLLNVGVKTVSSVELSVETQTGRGMYRVLDLNAPQGERCEVSMPAPDTRKGQAASRSRPLPSTALTS